MTYWKTIIAKLSSDQVETLQKFKKENGIKNNNQLVIRGLEELVGVRVADSNDPKNISLPKEYLTTYAFYEFLLSRFEKNPRITKRIKNCFLEWQEEYLTNYSHEHTIELLELEKIWKAFKEKKKPGRPKKPKQKIGRPKDRGI